MTPVEQIAPVADVLLDLEIELDRKTMTLNGVLELREGSVIKLTRSAGENIDLLVGGVRIGFGELVIIEDSMAVRITDFEAEE